MPTYTKVTRQEFPATDPARRGEFDVMYVYTDDRFQTFTIKVPKAEDNEDNIRAKLREAVEGAAAAGPQTIEI